jgi:hypothetical protein
VQSARRLPDLPALLYLLRGEPAQEWMLDDADLRAFASENMASRLEAMRSSDCDYLAIAWQHGEPLAMAWLEHWRQQWQASRRFVAGLACLGGLLHRHLQQSVRGQSASSGLSRQQLVSGLNYIFRRYSFEPAAACAHLVLIALDLENLRGELLQRALFAETAEGRA